MSDTKIQVPVPSVTLPPVQPPPVPVSIVDKTAKGINAVLTGTTLTITDSGVVPPPIEIDIGSRVQTVGQVNVRATPGGTLVGQQPNGTLGTVTAGPQTANAFPWWNVKFDSGPSGWVGADVLELAGPNPLQS